MNVVLQAAAGLYVRIAWNVVVAPHIAWLTVGTFDAIRAGDGKVHYARDELGQLCASSSLAHQTLDRGRIVAHFLAPHRACMNMGPFKEQADGQVEYRSD